MVLRGIGLSLQTVNGTVGKSELNPQAFSPESSHYTEQECRPYFNYTFDIEGFLEGRVKEKLCQSTVECPSHHIIHPGAQAGG